MSGIFTQGVIVRGDANFSGVDTFSVPQGTFARDRLTKTTETIQIPLTAFRKASDYLHLPASAGGDFAIIAGTFGTDSPILQGQSASGGSVTDNTRAMLALPECYVDGTDITCRLSARVDTAANTSATIDAEAHETDRSGSVGSALISASTQDINSTSYADKDFVIGGSNLVTGDAIDLQVTAAVDDSGGSNGSNAQIGAVELLMEVRG